MNKRKYTVELIAQIVKNAPQSQAVQTAEIIVDRLSEEGLLHLGYGNADIDKVVQKFTEVFGTTKVSKHDRFAANRLVSKYGSQSVCGIIQLMADKGNEKYAPVVNDISQLEQKFVSVLNFLRKSEKGGDLDG